MSWFKSKTKYVLLNTQGERVAEMSQTEYEAYAGTKAAMATTDAQAQAEAQQQQQADGGPPPEESAPPEAPPPEEAAPEAASEGDFASDLTTAFHKGRGAGEEQFDTSEGDDMIGKYYRSINDPLADIEGGLAIGPNGDIIRSGESGDITKNFVQGRFGSDFSEGAAEEALIEVTGDADIGRRFRPRIRVAREGKRRRREGVRMPPESPQARALRVIIKRQIPSRVVSKTLVVNWATARAGAPDGHIHRMFYERMLHCIRRRGATLSASKSATAGMGDFVGWA